MKGIFSLLHQTPTSPRSVTGTCAQMSGLARSAAGGRGPFGGCGDKKVPHGQS